MHTFNKKISFLYFGFICLAFLNFSFAQELDTELTTESPVVHVGDTVEVKLRVYPASEAEPVYTVSATALYDTTLLSFQNSYFATLKWFPLNRAPYVLEDTAQGMIRKTAGYPNGLKQDSDFITYVFKAISPGIATVSIEDGLSLDVYNQETKMSQRKIYIKIIGNEAVKGTEGNEDRTLKEEKSDSEIPRVVNIDLKIKGDTAFYRQEDYVMTVPQGIYANDVVATTFVEIYDENYKKVWNMDLTDLSGSGNDLEFTIPAYTLKKGNYIVSVKSLLSNGIVAVLDEKYIGVLDNGKGDLGDYRVIVLSLFFFFIFWAILHHMMLDVQMEDEEKTLKNQLQKLIRKKK